MKPLLSLTLLLLSSALSFAQGTQPGTCPTISVSSPISGANLGELATYSATVSNPNNYPIEYVWSVYGGRIKDGQGTSSIRVIRRADTLVATVKVNGLPEGCPSSASESVIYDAAPDPIKIYDLRANAIFDAAVAARVAGVMLENPNNQLYILAGDVGRKNASAFQQKQRSIIDLLSRQGITKERITIAPVYSDVELFQFWSVPPGASSPTCEECNELERMRGECPSISVTGPAGVTEPGENMTFAATITGSSPPGVTYVWSIENGEIVAGQGTSNITARHKLRWGGNVTAKVRVSGLPAECPSTAAETYPLIVDPGPEKLGSIETTKYTIDKNLIAKMGDALRDAPNSQLYVWVYLGSDRAKFPGIRARLLQQLSVTRIDPSRFTIEETSAKGRGAAFWLIRPGVFIPAP